MTGLILLDKPTGMTSFLACSIIRGVSKEKRVGHTGTLDPMATGVLPVLVGKATALSRYLIEADKRYTATIKLGVTTDTMDITGNVTATSDNIPSRDEIEKTVASFQGRQIQTPPIYSAIRVDGRRLYDIARNGEDVEIPKREVEIHSIDLIEFIGDDTFKIDVCCSKGTYIRSLANDIGLKLGCGATLSDLRRTETAGFGIDGCVLLAQIKENGAEQYLLPAQAALPHIKQLNISQKQAVRFTNGGALALERLNEKSLSAGDIRLVMLGERMLGVGRVADDSSELAPVTVIDKI